MIPRAKSLPAWRANSLTGAFDVRDHAFTRGEIAESIDRDPNTVATNLSRLKKRGLVQHRDRYWALTDDDDRFGPLIDSEADAEAWADAQPDLPHPSEREDTGDAGPSDAATEGGRHRHF